jgi:hypothetical protein
LLSASSTLEQVIEQYRNTGEANDHVWSRFTELTNAVPFLKAHRDHVEANGLGFGDRAFHFLWLLILDYLSRHRLPNDLLEIGVYKGQVISLWSLIARERQLPLRLHAVSPMAGDRFVATGKLDLLLRKVSRPYAAYVESGNAYRAEDYEAIARKFFSDFSLDFQAVDLIKGYSSDADVIGRVSNRSYSVVYIDGDHRYEGVVADIKNYAPLVCPNGFLVMDDASANLPGTAFFKGHQSVSDACELIEPLGFNNVLNVGHNRVYRRTT